MISKERTNWETLRNWAEIFKPGEKIYLTNSCYPSEIPKNAIGILEGKLPGGEKRVLAYLPDGRLVTSAACWGSILYSRNKKIIYIPLEFFDRGGKILILYSCPRGTIRVQEVEQIGDRLFVSQVGELLV